MNKVNWTAVAIVSIIALLILMVGASVLGGSSYGGWGMMGPGMMGGFGMGLFGPILMVVFLGLVVWAVVAFVQGSTSPSPRDLTSGQSDSALEVLKRRYAKGEISKEEYEEKKRELA